MQVSKVCIGVSVLGSQLEPQNPGFIERAARIGIQQLCKQPAMITEIPDPEENRCPPYIILFAQTNWDSISVPQALKTTLPISSTGNFPKAEFSEPAKGHPHKQAFLKIAEGSAALTLVIKFITT